MVKGSPANVEQKPSSPAPSDPDGYDMTYLWQKVEAGRYAAKYRNALVEVIRNPNYPDDPRRYQPCVNSRPVDVPKHTLKDAQSTAIRHVVFASQSARPRLEQVEQQPVEPVEQRVAEIVDADFMDVEQPQDEPQPVELRALPPPAAEPQQVTFTITGTVTTSDHIAAMSDIRAAVDMLRSVAKVQCRIVPPEFIDL